MIRGIRIISIALSPVICTVTVSSLRGMKIHIPHEEPSRGIQYQDKTILPEQPHNDKNADTVCNKTD
jgi:hypothetical protein